MEIDALKIPVYEVAEALGLSIKKKGNEYLCACPFVHHEHDDVDPKCVLGGKQNVAHCLKCGVAKDNLGLVMQVLKLEPKEAGGWLRKTFGLSSDMPVISNEPIAQLANLRGWSLSAFEILGCREDKDKGNVEFPMRDAAGKEVGHKLRRGNGKKFGFGNHPKSYTPKGLKAGLFYPLDDLEDGDVFIVEGEADTAAAISASFHNVIGTAGVNPGEIGEQSLQQLCTGRKCTLFPDPGAGGRKWLETVGRLLSNAQCKVWYVPAAKKDLDSRLYGLPDKRLAVLMMLETSIRWVDTKEGMPEDLSVIYLNDIIIGKATDQCIDALHSKNNPPQIFVMDGETVRIRRTEKQIIKIQQMTRPSMRLRLGRVAYFIIINSKGEEKYKAPPDNIVESVLCHGVYPFPPLEAITAAPVLRKDGTICVETGYDESTKMYYWPPDDFDFPPVPENPTKEEAFAARDLLLDVIADFPFRDDASKANAIALLFTMVMRQIIDGYVPLAIIEAPVQGTGKSKLVENLSMIAFGQYTTISAPTGREEDEEWRKLITSTLKDGPPAIIIDNFRERDTLQAAPLAQLLTQPTWSARELGTTKQVHSDNKAVWMATGNNIKIGGDITRRIYSIRIDANMEKPWERDPAQFRHQNLNKHVKENRNRLLAAAFTIVRYWFTLGKPIPEDAPIMGSFEEWVSDIAGVLDCVDIHGFLMNRIESLQVQDEEALQWAAFFDSWYDNYGEEEITAAELSAEIMFESSELSKSTLPDSLTWAKDRGKGSLTISLGKRLGMYVERIFGGKKLLYRIAPHTKKKHYHLELLRQKGCGRSAEGAEGSEMHKSSNPPPTNSGELFQNPQDVGGENPLAEGAVGAEGYVGPNALEDSYPTGAHKVENSHTLLGVNNLPHLPQAGDQKLYNGPLQTETVEIEPKKTPKKPSAPTAPSASLRKVQNRQPSADEPSDSIEIPKNHKNPQKHLPHLPHLPQENQPCQIDTPAKLARKPCPRCGENTWWESIHGAILCGKCHPPSTEQIVRRWLEKEDV